MDERHRRLQDTRPTDLLQHVLKCSLPEIGGLAPQALGEQLNSAVFDVDGMRDYQKLSEQESS